MEYVLLRTERSRHLIYVKLFYPFSFVNAILSKGRISFEDGLLTVLHHCKVFDKHLKQKEVELLQLES